MSLPISLTGASSSSSGSAIPQNSQLSMGDFLSLMTQQMENQDPLDPVSNADFFAQMAQLGQVQGMNQLTNSAQVQQAQSLMGQTVTATATVTDANGNTQSGIVTGVVKSLSINNGTYSIGIQQANGVIVSAPLSGIQAVQQTPDIGSLGNLVGKSVTGSITANGQTTQVTGTVSSVQIASGVPTVVVTGSNGSTTTMPVSQLTSIGTSAGAAAAKRAVTSAHVRTH